jgi:hypothetical protein
VQAVSENQSIKKRVFVVAGSLHEFINFCDQTIGPSQEMSLKSNGAGHLIINSTEYTYVQSVQQLKGLREVGFEFYGTYLDRPDLTDIRLEFEQMRLSGALNAN